MSSDRHRDVHLLSDLRAKFGHQIVDALIERMVIAPAPLTEALRHAVESMLSWQPESGPSMHSAAPQVQRASPEDLLSDLPSPLHDLAAAVASATTLVARQMDELETAFLALAEQSYVPFLAASRDDRSNSQWNPLRLRQTTAHKRATKAMESDSALARLCKAREFVTSFGHPKQWARLYDAVELLVYGAWRLCLLRGDWSPATFGASVIEQLGRIRSASVGENVAVPIFLGFSGGYIATAARARESHARPYRSSLQNCLFDRHDRFGEETSGFIIERSLPWTYQTIQTEQANGETNCPPGKLTQKDWAHLQQWADSFAVALAWANSPCRVKPHELLKPSTVTAAPQLRWVVTADPLYGATSFHVSQEWLGPQAQPLSLTESILEETEHINSIADASTRTAVRRLRRALAEHQAWRDSLVDAVVAWEAMSGNCRGAVTLKVSAVMARLAAAPGVRMQVLKQIQSIYGSRSRIVHGGEDDVRKEQCDAAILVALAALRRLIYDFPHLMGESERFDRLCLDDGDSDNDRKTRVK